MNFGLLGKILVLTGVVIIVLGITMMFLDKIPFVGKLPGDIVIRKRNFTLYFPLGTMILLSAGLTLVFYIISHIKK